MSADDTEFWMPWSAEVTAEISVDGKQLHHILQAIKSQLEVLRRQQNKILDFGNTGEMMDRIQLLTIKVESIENHIAENDRLRAKELDEKHKEIVEEMDQKIAALRISIEKELTEKLEKSTADSREKRLSEMNAIYEEKFTDMQEGVDFYIKNHSSTHETLQNYLNEYIEKPMIVLKDQANELDAQVHQLRDILSVNELRLKSVESKADRTAQIADKVDRELAQYESNFLFSVYDKIERLQKEKAMKADMQLKADAFLLDTKADLAEIERLNKSHEEFDRRLNHQVRELQESYRGMQKKLEKKTEKIAKWCLQQIRKEVNVGPTEAGTDIGRIRCLVCDQTVTQQQETEIVHTGINGLRASVKILKSGGHATSPSPERGRGRGHTRNTEETVVENWKQGIRTNRHGKNDDTVSPPKSKSLGIKNAVEKGQEAANEMLRDHIKVNGTIHLKQRGTESPLVQLKNITTGETGAVITDDLPNSHSEDPDYIQEFKYRYIFENNTSLDPSDKISRKEGMVLNSPITIPHSKSPSNAPPIISPRRESATPNHLLNNLISEQLNNNDIQKNPLLMDPRTHQYRELDNKFAMKKSESTGGSLRLGSAGLAARGTLLGMNRPASASMRRIKSAQIASNTAN